MNEIRYPLTAPDYSLLSTELENDLIICILNPTSTFGTLQKEIEIIQKSHPNFHLETQFSNRTLTATAIEAMNKNILIELVKHSFHLLNLGRDGFTPLCDSILEIPIQQQNPMFKGQNIEIPYLTIEIPYLLCKLGADVNLAVSKDNCIPKYHSTLYSTDIPQGATPLWLAAEKTSNLELVCTLLLCRGIAHLDFSPHAEAMISEATDILFADYGLLFKAKKVTGSFFGALPEELHTVIFQKYVQLTKYRYYEGECTSSIAPRVKDLLKDSGVWSTPIHHDPFQVNTSQNFKSLSKTHLLKIDGVFALFVANIYRFIRLDDVKKRLNATSVQLASSKEVFEITGLRASRAISPFSDPTAPLALYIDSTIASNMLFSFSAGSLSNSFTMMTADYIKISKGTQFKFTY